MITETMENGVYRCVEGDRTLLTIFSLGDNVFRAINDYTDIIAKVIPLDDYTTNVICIEHKRADKNGKFRKSTKLLQHNLSWLDYILEETGFIRKKKCRS